MRPIRFPLMVVALLAVGLAAGFALHQLIGPRESKDEEVARVQPKATTRGNEETPGGGFLSGSEFGGEVIGGDFSGIGFENEYGYPSRVMIWVEAMFLQVDTAELDSVLVGGDPAFRRGSEKLVLNSDEKEELLRGLSSTQSFRIISSVSVTSVSGQQALMQFIEEVPYSTERRSEAAEGQTSPAGPARSEEGASFYVKTVEPLEVGSRLNVTAAVSSDGIITLVLLPEISFLTGWMNLGDRPPLPAYFTWDLTTTLYCRDGMSILMAGVPLSRYGGTPYPNAKAEAEAPGSETVLVLITARLIEPAADDEEEQASEEAPEETDSPEGDRSPETF